MRERRYNVDSKARYPSPRRLSSRHRDYSPRRRHDGEKSSREYDRSRKIEIKDGVDRDRRFLDNVDRDRRFLDTVDRGRRFPDDVDRGRKFPDAVDRDRHVRTRRLHSRSPHMIESRDLFDKNMNVQSATFSSYDVRDRGKYGVGVECPRRLYDEGLLCRDSTMTKFQLDHLSDGPRKSYGLNEKYGSCKNDDNGAGDNDISRGGGEKEFYPRNQYVDASKNGFSSMIPNLAGTEPYFLEYEKGGKMHSDLYTLNHGGLGAVTKSYLNSGDGNDHMPAVASKYLNTDTDKQGYFHFKNELQLEMRSAEFCNQGTHYFEKNDEDFNYKDVLHLDKLETESTAGRYIYRNKKEDNLTSSPAFLRSDSEYIGSSSRSKDHERMSSNIYKEGFPCYSTAREFQLSSHGIQPGSELVSDSFRIDGYSEKPRRMSPIGSGGRFDDIKSHSRSNSGLPEEKRRDTFYPEFGRSIEPIDVGEEHEVHRMSRFFSLDSINESSHLKQMEGHRLLVLPRSDNFGAYGSVHPRNHELDIMGSGSLHLPYEREVYHGHGNDRRGEHDYGAYGGPRSLVERSDSLPIKDDPSWGSIHGGLRKGLDLADMSSDKLSKTRLGDKCAMDNMLYGDCTEIRISSDGSGARKICSHLETGDDMVPARFLKKPKLSKSKLEKSGRKSRNEAVHKKSSSWFITSHLSGPHRSGSRDIKKRLGPVPRKLHVSQRLVKKYKPSIKKRLAPASKKHAIYPWLKSTSSNRMPSIQEDVDGNLHDQGGEHLGENFPPLVHGPPEMSEDFKQLVQSAFFKFLKQINETTGKRKEYVEHGKDGSLKCIVCGSNSSRYVDTESLVMHAFTSKKVGLKSQHLGLYKALCLLMGWGIAEEPGSDWHCEVMPIAEASALKEDIIIWPPVIIVHNYSIHNKKSDERVIVATETLDAKLRGMGFGSVLKVSNGKPANQSVMIVKFNGTLSGLQEAEKLHQTYVENKHGREQLKQLMSTENTSSGEGIQVVPADDENFLYGYLGIVEDLSKLDFDTKKRCVVRSKKRDSQHCEFLLDAKIETLNRILVFCFSFVFVQFFSTSPVFCNDGSCSFS